MSNQEPQILTYRYRLNPSRTQHRALERVLSQQRMLWNAALEERILAYRMAGKTITEVEQSRSLTIIRRDDPEFAAVQRRIQRETLRRLDRAYKAFYRRAREGAGGASGFPKFKGREHFDGFGFDAFAQVKWDGKRLRFAGMAGALRVYLDRPLPKVTDPDTGEKVVRIKGLWFKREGERWFCGFQAESDTATPKVKDKEIGVDWGTSVLAALSSGEMIPNPRHGEQGAKALKRAQRALARCKRGSKRRAKVRARKAAVERKVRNQRRNHLDKVSARLTKQFRFIAVEKIDVKGMMDAERPGETLPQFVKTRRNREALEASPFLLRQMLDYKAKRSGAKLIAIDPKNTTQECFWCGRLHLKELTDMEHICTTAGMFQGRRTHRKTNAARVILKRALSAQADDDRGGPVPGGAKPNTGSVGLGNTGAEQSASGRRPQRGLPYSRAMMPRHRLRPPPIGKRGVHAHAEEPRGVPMCGPGGSGRPCACGGIHLVE